MAVPVDSNPVPPAIITVVHHRNAGRMDHLEDDAAVLNAEEYGEESDSMLTSASPPEQRHDLERCGQWLRSITPRDLGAMQPTQEYRDFIAAFERLANTHTGRNRTGPSSAAAAAPPDKTPSKEFSFLQHMADDDIVVRTFEFLECQTLVRVSLTCARFLELAHRSAAQRTYDVAQARQLNSVMKLLRAKEQIDGIGTGIRDRHVRVPVLLLGRRVLVTQAGDPEYNGVYYCTGSNGNGFIFTKPRFPERRILRTQGVQLRVRESISNADQRGRLESEVAHPGQLLRCIIAKRFSNETILWYISKEVLSTENQGDVRAGAVSQTFSYWSKLMVVGDASPDICRYPSQTSILARHHEGWQTLTTTRATRPPIVELLD